MEEVETLILSLMLCEQNLDNLTKMLNVTALGWQRTAETHQALHLLSSRPAP